MFPAVTCKVPAAPAKPKIKLDFIAQKLDLSGILESGALDSFQFKKMVGYISNPLAGKNYPFVLPVGVSTVGPSKLDDVGSQSLRFQTMTDLGNYSKLRLIASYHRASNNGPSATTLVDPVMS